MNIADSANSAEAVRAGRNPLWRVLFGCAVMYLVLQGGLIMLMPSLDQPSAASETQRRHDCAAGGASSGQG